MALFLSYIFLSARSDVRNAPVQCNAMAIAYPTCAAWRAMLVQPVHGCATMQRRNDVQWESAKERETLPVLAITSELVAVSHMLVLRAR